ncbi:MAG: lysylphosphatidylglycerol synthase domain-containing protein [Pyrinomonadaceae bacterium]
MNPATRPPQISTRNLKRLKLAALALTLFGLALFAYFIYAVGFNEIYLGVSTFGIDGFVVIVLLYFLRICARAAAWKLSVHEPFSLRLRDTVPAVVIGEAMSSTIPLGIMVSGTSKTLAVRKHIPLVAGFSSVATENLFYSLVTCIFLILGAISLLYHFTLDQSSTTAINLLIGILIILIILGFVMVIRQWHALSTLCEWLYKKGILARLLARGRKQARRFEELIYDFYRSYPRRFLPICLLQVAYHALGIIEVLYVLSRLDTAVSTLLNAFLLESVSRLITIIFKLIPFVMGVDEAGAQFVGETLGLAAGVGVTLAIIRKGRILFWTAIGMLLIVKRGLTFHGIEPSEQPDAIYTN